MPTVLEVVLRRVNSGCSDVGIQLQVAGRGEAAWQSQRRPVGRGSPLGECRHSGLSQCFYGVNPILRCQVPSQRTVEHRNPSGVVLRIAENGASPISNELTTACLPG